MLKSASLAVSVPSWPTVEAALDAPAAALLDGTAAELLELAAPAELLAVPLHAVRPRTVRQSAAAARARRRPGVRGESSIQWATGFLLDGDRHPGGDDRHR